MLGNSDMPRRRLRVAHKHCYCPAWNHRTHDPGCCAAGYDSDGSGCSPAGDNHTDDFNSSGCGTFYHNKPGYKESGGGVSNLNKPRGPHKFGRDFCCPRNDHAPDCHGGCSRRGRSTRHHVSGPRGNDKCSASDHDNPAISYESRVHNNRWRCRAYHRSFRSYGDSGGGAFNFHATPHHCSLGHSYDSATCTNHGRRPSDYSQACHHGRGTPNNRCSCYDSSGLFRLRKR